MPLERARINCDWRPIRDGFVCSVCGGRTSKVKTRNCPGAQRAGNPGTELRKILERFGFSAGPKCGCEGLRILMDGWGSDLCGDNIDELARRLQLQAVNRRLPLASSWLGRRGALLLIRWAIRNSRRAG